MMDFNVTETYKDGKKTYTLNFFTDDESVLCSMKNRIDEIAGYDRRKFTHAQYITSIIMRRMPSLGLEKAKTLAEYLVRNSVEAQGCFKTFSLFQRYCNRASSCDMCNKHIRKLCRAKDRIAKKQCEYIDKHDLFFGKEIER